MEEVTSNTQKQEYVYRFLPLRYFLSMLKRGALYLPRVRKWEDPYELFLFKQTVIDSKGNEVNMLVEADRIYGQCWTAKRDSDAMWRIYSPDKMSVRIKTTIEEIEKMKSQNIGNGILPDSNPITYKSKTEINNEIKSLTYSSLTTNILRNSLFIKRNEFDHEKEYRIIAWLTDFDEKGKYIANTPEYVELPFQDGFIKEVFLDPRLSDDEVAMLKNAISIRMGANCPVSQSTLYKFNKYVIK